MTKKVVLFLYMGIIFSCLTIGLGLSVLIGWYFGISWLLQYQDVTIAMVYNSALSFAIFGFCVLLLLFHYYKISRILTAMLILLSVLVLFQTITGVNLSVDEVFFHHNYNIVNYYPGRMAPNTTISFVMIGLVILIISRPHWTFKMGVTAALITVSVLFMALLFASGYVSSLQNAYEWSHYTPMALNTAIGFILLSLALIFALLYRCHYHGISIWSNIPAILGLVMFLTISMLAISVHKQQYTQNVESLLPLIIFILGSVFTLLFSLLLHYAQQQRRYSNKEKKLRALTEATLDATNDGILAWNKNGLITHCNQKFSELWQIPFETVQGNYILQILGRMSEQAIDKNHFRETMNALIQLSYKNKRVTLNLKKKRYIEACIQTRKTEGFSLIWVFSFHDITVAKNLETELIHYNTHDLLTGLPNKALIVNMLAIAIQGTLHSQNQIAVFLVDIDKFTQINDVFGRSKGDELIQIIAKRLQAAVSGSGTLCRLGGDEFVLITSLNNNKESQQIIDVILLAMKPVFDFHDSQLNITCTIGVAFCPRDATHAEELLRCADIAMIRAKKQGRNSFMYYTHAFSTYTYASMTLENELHTALEKKEFELFYQPLIELKTKKILGVEALLRWKNPRLGLLTPDYFLSSIDELGLHNDVSAWVLNEACSNLKRWYKNGLPLIKVSVNITAHQFKNNRLLEDIKNILSRHDLPASCLELELTEQTLIEGSQEVFDALAWLKQNQITIALDDFGTGYSSLNYIKNFPLDKLKIDQSFTRDMLLNEKNKELLKAIINLAKILNLSVLAEGIEKQEQLSFLKANDCTYGQGFFFARPMTSAHSFNFLKKYKYGCIPITA